MDIIMGYGTRFENPTIYDPVLDVVEVCNKWGEPEGIELFANFEIGANIEYCSAFADFDGAINPGYPMGNAATYKVIEKNISWCNAKLRFGVG